MSVSSTMIFNCIKILQGEMLIFMEFCSAGTLEDVSKQGLTEPLIRQYTSQLLQAVHVLHDNAIVHRDIKGNWIFFSKVFFYCI